MAQVIQGIKSGQPTSHLFQYHLQNDLNLKFTWKIYMDSQSYNFSIICK